LVFNPSAERRSAQTLTDDRRRLNAFSRALGQAKAAAVKRSDILGYLEGIPVAGLTSDAPSRKTDPDDLPLGELR
jgi:hypothetical protein